MPSRKKRETIPEDVAAEVLYASNRTCCVCSIPGQPLQIHHIDENPSNNIFDNLAPLCMNCHRDTQISGGFDRKLNASQMRLFRAGWYERVRRRRDAADRGYVRLSVSQNGSARRQDESSTRTPEPLPDYLARLPRLRRDAYAAAQEDWNSDVRTCVFQASIGVAEYMKAILIGLLSYYPPRHFGTSPKRCVESKADAFFRWHLAGYEPEGPGTAGKLAHNFSAYAVIGDLERLILQVVRGLSWTHTDINFEVWREEWEAAG